MDQILPKIVDANYGKPGISVLSLGDYRCFLSGLEDDVQTILKQEKPSRVPDVDHPTRWTNPMGVVEQYSCVNVEGRFDGTTPPEAPYFHSHDRYPALGSFISGFKPLNFRINVMYAGSCLGPHKEQVVVRGDAKDRVKLKVRFHLPVFTNANAYIMADWKDYVFQPGILYYLNNGCVHSAGNEDAERIRVHLVWDQYYEDAFHLMEKAVPVMPRRAWTPWEKYPSEGEHVSYKEAVDWLVGDECT